MFGQSPMQWIILYSPRLLGGLSCGNRENVVDGRFGGPQNFALGTSKIGGGIDEDMHAASFEERLMHLFDEIDVLVKLF